MASNDDELTKSAFTELKTIIVKRVITPKLFDVMLQCIAYNAIDGETSTIVGSFYHTMKEISDTLDKRFPSASFASRMEVLLETQKVFETYGSGSGGFKIFEQAEKKLSDNLKELNAKTDSIALTIILTEYELLYRAFNQFLSSTDQERSNFLRHKISS